MAVEDQPQEAGLSSVTNIEWLEAHKRLAESGVIPAEELEFIWNPNLDPAELIGDDEEEVAPDG